MTVLPEIAALTDEMESWRHDFHAHPEIGYEEVRTSGIVADLLTSWGIDVHRGLGKTGLVGVLTGRPGSRSIGLRADMDALAMEEFNDFAHRSRIKNRMHGCGHEGHTSMLLGAAKHLAATRNFSGTVNFIFQPAEEGLAGARSMINDGLFESFPCDAVYGIHNDPSTDLGLVNVRAGGMLAASDFFVVRIRGRGSHGAQPHLGVDPICVAGHIITIIPTLVARRISPADTAVISIGQVIAGSSNNVIPETAEIRGTIRTLTPEVRRQVEGLFKQAVEKIAAAQGADVEIEYIEGYPATINTAAEADIAALAASKIVGEKNILKAEASWTASEDFAYMLQRKPGAYAFFGQRTPDRGGIPLHNPKYDFNDDLLPIGASFFVELTERILGSRQIEDSSL